MRRTRTLTGLGVLPLLLLGAACGKDGGGGRGLPSVATDPNAPVIVNLRVSFGKSCTLPNNRLGTVETLAFDYTDADGNLRGGVLENKTSAAVGDPITFTGALPSPGVVMSGTTSGTITVAGCLAFGSNSSVGEQVRVTDTSGKASNVLSLEVTRPAGVPLLPHSDKADFGKRFELGP
jgi:hypothetical protein